jgi:hypothetical protein
MNPPKPLTPPSMSVPKGRPDAVSSTPPAPPALSSVFGKSTQWVQIGALNGGDLLEILTETNTYIIAICGMQRGLMISSNNEVDNGEVSLLGSWIEGGEPVWGTIKKGAGLLFSKINEQGVATKTSTIKEIFLRHYSTFGGGHSPTSATANLMTGGGTVMQKNSIAYTPKSVPRAMGSNIPTPSPRPKPGVVVRPSLGKR